MAFKELYTFTVEREQEVEKTHTRTNKKSGEKTTVTKKVKEKTPIEVKLKRPSRRELEDAELEYSATDKDKRTEKQKERLEKIKDELSAAKRQMVEVESSMHTLFDHTADTKAQNRLILWYTLMLTHIQEEGDENPVAYFKGENFEDKVEDYYAKEEEGSDFYLEVIKKITTVLAFWFFNQASTPEEFNALIEQMENGEI